jgi:hypothetical protein
MLARVAGAAPLTAPVSSTKPMPLVVHSGIWGSMIAAPRMADTSSDTYLLANLI